MGIQMQTAISEHGQCIVLQKRFSRNALKVDWVNFPFLFFFFFFGGGGGGGGGGQVLQKETTSVTS